MHLVFRPSALHLTKDFGVHGHGVHRVAIQPHVVLHFCVGSCDALSFRVLLCCIPLHSMLLAC